MFLFHTYVQGSPARALLSHVFPPIVVAWIDRASEWSFVGRMEEGRAQAGGTSRPAPARVVVLHVEHDLAHHVAVERLLRCACSRLEFVLARSVAEALEACARRRFDVLLIEVNLGREAEGGFRVIEALSRAGTQIPAIALTTLTTYRVVARCKALGVPCFPKVGVDFDDLAAQLLSAVPSRSSSGTFARVTPAFPAEPSSGVRLHVDDPAREAAVILLKAEGSLKERIDRTELLFVQEFVRSCAGNRSAAAVGLKTTRQTIQRILRDDDDE